MNQNIIQAFQNGQASDQYDPNVENIQLVLKKTLYFIKNKLLT